MVWPRTMTQNGPHVEQVWVTTPRRRRGGSVVVVVERRCEGCNAILARDQKYASCSPCQATNRAAPTLEPLSRDGAAHNPNERESP